MRPAVQTPLRGLTKFRNTREICRREFRSAQYPVWRRFMRRNGGLWRIEDWLLGVAYQRFKLAASLIWPGSRPSTPPLNRRHRLGLPAQTAWRFTASPQLRLGEIRRFTGPAAFCWPECDYEAITRLRRWCVALRQVAASLIRTGPSRAEGQSPSRKGRHVTSGPAPGLL